MADLGKEQLAAGGSWRNAHLRSDWRRKGKGSWTDLGGRKAKHAGLAHAEDHKAVTVFLTHVPASPGHSKHCKNI